MKKYPEFTNLALRIETTDYKDRQTSLCVTTSRELGNDVPSIFLNGQKSLDGNPRRL